MVKVLVTVALAISFFTSMDTKASMFPNIDINDPNLTVEIAAKQCEKSYMHAPNKLEEWCEKAYEMGYLESLYYIGMHTGDGSRYLNELNTRIEQGDANAINTLAWLYQSGRLVKKDLSEATRLYKLYLAQENNQAITLKTSTHFELATIYRKLGMWDKVITHTQYLIDNAKREGRRELAQRWRDEAETSLKESNL
jgi:hypothetical protein